MVHEAQSGHISPGFSAADIMAALYFDLLRIDPHQPSAPDRDRFVLSKGHACPVLYATLALRGYFPVEELKTLRRLGTRLQGHPVAGYLPGVDATTGSLGLGASQATGMALEGRLVRKDYDVGPFSETANWPKESSGKLPQLRRNTSWAIWSSSSTETDCRPTAPAKP